MSFLDEPTSGMDSWTNFGFVPSTSDIATDRLKYFTEQLQAGPVRTPPRGENCGIFFCACETQACG